MTDGKQLTSPLPNAVLRASERELDMWGIAFRMNGQSDVKQGVVIL
jgi:hypothetical protein